MSLTTILVKALTNTLLGMGTVFLVLVFIAFLISMLPRVTNMIESIGKKRAEVTVSAEKKDDGAARTVKTSEMPEISFSHMPEDNENNLELIAVITAAIAAGEKISTDDFIVRSIRKSARNQWKNH